MKTTLKIDKHVPNGHPHWGSNDRSSNYKSGALPTELAMQTLIVCGTKNTKVTRETFGREYQEKTTT